MVWSCFPFKRSDQNHLARHSERGKKTRRTKEEVGRQHQGMNRPGIRQVPEGSWEQGKMEKTGCKIICGAPTTLAVRGLMTMMMILKEKVLKKYAWSGPDVHVWRGWLGRDWDLLPCNEALTLIVWRCVWHVCSLWGYVNLPFSFFRFFNQYTVYIL